MKAKRVGALLLSAVLTVSLLSGCSSRSQVTEDMIPTVTDLQEDSGEEVAEASVIGLSMNKSYVAELTRLDGDNTEKAKVSAKEIQVVLKATSLDKDLKVKIVNKATGKVITGTAFEVTVKDSENKTESYTDKDKDGIIYVKSMTPGKCKISMKASGGYAAPADITAYRRISRRTSRPISSIKQWTYPRRSRARARSTWPRRIPILPATTAQVRPRP